ncbi:HdeD family acid-resistance protein [Cellulosimicrobium arenosum]|uniref:HdeD family acid-resistance protein n=1 Tax=Cellulosimicrobium arenosum TaxID=2708133 RepID=A0A927J0H7_9MICO|nr:HdeD family acid-resistance protein [Cellulosimicrobium arenosum]MBD8079649.1 HdeD family acid-resistance protein [Cellulosimicrobium arenosum]
MTQDPILSAFSTTAKQVWYWPLIRGVVAIALGIVAIAWPGITAAALIWVIGIFAVVDGILEIVEGIRRRGTGGATALLVTMGVLSLAVGILLLVWPGKTAIVLTWIVGFWLVVYGLFQSISSLELRKVPGSGWGWGVFAGVLALVFGLLVLFNVNAGLVSIVWLIAVFTIIWGIMLVAFGFQIRSLGKQAGTAAARGY